MVVNTAMNTIRVCILILSAIVLRGQISVPQSDENDPDLPRLVCRMALFAQQLSDLPGAEKLARHGLALFTRSNSLETADGAACLTSYAGLFEAKGLEQEAQKQLENALAVRERLFGPDHFLVADTLIRLGLTHSRQGHLQEAEQIEVRAVEILRSQLPTPELAAALNNLGNVMSAQGRSKEAESRLREAISIWEKVRGPDDASMAPGLLNLGILLQARKQYDEAGRLIARALKLDEKSLPANHPRIGMDLNAAGVLAMARKNYREAETLLVRASTILEASQSPQHAEIGQVLLNLAEAYRLQKKTDQARDTFERGLGAAALAWGPSDPRLPDWMERLAATLRQQEDYAGAEELEMRATRIRVLHTIR
jgi:tetratricopeptide (TPR) repeat protein